MLKSCLPYLGSPKYVDNNSESFDSTFQSNHIFVRVVHAGGRVEHYPNAVLVAKLLENLPAGKCLTRPEVFKQPHESILGPEEYLLPGHKYYVVPLSTINKLKRKYGKIPANMMKQVVERRIDDQDITSDASSAVEAADYWSEEFIDDSFPSASEFYARNETKKSASSTRGNGNDSRKGGRIMVSHAKPKTCSQYTWEPGLTSIKELSP